MKFVNLTPHIVNLCDKDGNVLVSFPKPDNGTKLPRLVSTPKYEMVDGVPLGVEKYGEIKNLPSVKENTTYIVSFLVNQAAREKGRTDTVFPAGKMFRDEQGRIKGMQFLATSFRKECSF